MNVNKFLKYGALVSMGACAYKEGYVRMEEDLAYVGTGEEQYNPVTKSKINQLIRCLLYGKEKEILFECKNDEADAKKDIENIYKQFDKIFKYEIEMKKLLKLFQHEYKSDLKKIDVSTLLSDLDGKMDTVYEFSKNVSSQNADFAESKRVSDNIKIIFSSKETEVRTRELFIYLFRVISALYGQFDFGAYIINYMNDYNEKENNKRKNNEKEVHSDFQEGCSLEIFLNIIDRVYGVLNCFFVPIEKIDTKKDSTPSENDLALVFDILTWVFYGENSKSYFTKNFYAEDIKLANANSEKLFLFLESCSSFKNLISQLRIDSNMLSLFTHFFSNIETRVSFKRALILYSNPINKGWIQYIIDAVKIKNGIGLKKDFLKDVGTDEEQYNPVKKSQMNQLICDLFSGKEKEIFFKCKNEEADAKKYIENIYKQFDKIFKKKIETQELLKLFQHEYKKDLENCNWSTLLSYLDGKMETVYEFSKNVFSQNKNFNKFFYASNHLQKLINIQETEMKTRELFIFLFRVISALYGQFDFGTYIINYMNDYNEKEKNKRGNNEKEVHSDFQEGCSLEIFLHTMDCVYYVLNCFFVPIEKIDSKEDSILSENDLALAFDMLTWVFYGENSKTYFIKNFYDEDIKVANANSEELFLFLEICSNFKNLVSQLRSDSNMLSLFTHFFSNIEARVLFEEVLSYYLIPHNKRRIQYILDAVKIKNGIGNA